MLKVKYISFFYQIYNNINITDKYFNVSRKIRGLTSSHVRAVFRK